MSGHSKWSTIKRKKANLDAKRGKIWTKILREVTVSARMGGGDPNGNPRLRSAIQEARSNNVPSDNIDRAIKKGTGDLEGASYEEISYEGYGPGGVALLVETITDNRNRTVSEIRHLLSKNDGNLGENGCVSWMFERRGYFSGELGSLDEEGLMEVALEVGAEDFSVENGRFEIYSAVEDYAQVREQLEAKGLTLDVRQLAMVPQNYTPVPEDKAPTLIRLMEALEDHDDVQNVWANGELGEIDLDA